MKGNKIRTYFYLYVHLSTYLSSFFPSVYSSLIVCLHRLLSNTVPLIFYSLGSTLLQKDNTSLNGLNTGALMNLRSFSTCHWECVTLSDKGGVMWNL